MIPTTKHDILAALLEWLGMALLTIALAVVMAFTAWGFFTQPDAADVETGGEIGSGVQEVKKNYKN